MKLWQLQRYDSVGDLTDNALSIEQQLSQLRKHFEDDENVLALIIQCGLEYLMNSLIQIIEDIDPSLSSSDLLAFPQTVLTMSIETALEKVSRLAYMAEIGTLCSRSQLPWDSITILLRQAASEVIIKEKRPLHWINIPRSTAWELHDKWNGTMRVPPSREIIQVDGGECKSYY